MGPAPLRASPPRSVELAMLGLFVQVRTYRQDVSR